MIINVLSKAVVPRRFQLRFLLVVKNIARMNVRVCPFAFLSQHPQRLPTFHNTPQHPTTLHNTTSQQHLTTTPHNNTTQHHLTTTPHNNTHNTSQQHLTTTTHNNNSPQKLYNSHISSANDNDRSRDNSNLRLFHLLAFPVIYLS